MSLSAPKQIVFLVSLVFFVLGVLDQYGIFSAPFVAAYDYIIAWVLLALGCILKGF